MSDGKYRPEVGDRVRVVLEGEVRATTTETFAVGDGSWSNIIHPDSEHVVSVEKVGPPVEVFGPGDTVRSKDFPDIIYSIGHDGHYAHLSREWRATALGDRSEFNSTYYERVELE